jgi:hypothetical protein
MSDDRSPGETLTPEDLEHVPEHLEDAEPAQSTPEAPVTPGGPLRFARMTGSSIAGRDAAPWITDFLNAAYYRRSVEDRDVDDIGLAFAVLTTFWYRKERGCRLRITDLGAAQHAFWGQGDVERLSMLHQLAKRIA